MNKLDGRKILISELTLNEWYSFSQFGNGYSDGILLRRVEGNIIELVHYYDNFNNNGIQLEDCDNHNFTRLMSVYPKALDYSTIIDKNRKFVGLNIEEFYNSVYLEVYERVYSNEISNDNLLKETHIEKTFLFPDDSLSKLEKKFMYVFKDDVLKIGDKIKFTQVVRDCWVLQAKTGQVGTIEDIDMSKKLASIKLSNGNIVKASLDKIKKYKKKDKFNLKTCSNDELLDKFEKMLIDEQYKHTQTKSYKKLIENLDKFRNEILTRMKAADH